MNRPTLDWFIRHCFEYPASFPRNLWVNETGFSALYVRFGQRVIKGQLYRPTLDLASIEAEHPGQGAFKSLVRRLRTENPELNLYVENVLDTKFRAGLERIGFIDVGPKDLPCFFLPAKERLEAK